MKELVYFQQPREEKMIGDEAHGSGLRVLRSSIENMDVAKPFNDLDEDVTKGESYDEPRCMPGEGRPRNQNMLQSNPSVG